jgi:ABC-type uncharacterized transport system permease subunit
MFWPISPSEWCGCRANFLISLLGALLTSGGALFGLMVLSGDGQPVGGWSYREASIVENITELFNGLFRAGQFPVTVFPGWVRVFFTFIVPVAFITTVPAEAVVGRIRPEIALASAGVALALLAISRWFWGVALRSYTSASS